MGHLINPVRFRIGNTLFWANNWPAKEETSYFLSYEIHQEMDQYFKTLFHYFRKLKLKRRRKGGKKILRKYRHPKLYYSNVKVNLFGFNLDKIMIDVNIYDFFLDRYIEESLSSESSKLSSFLKKFNRYVGFEFFFKYKRILKNLTRQQFSAIVNVCRKKVELLQQIAINKLQIFIEMYIEFIRRSLFSIYNDKNKLFDITKSLFSKEKRLLSKLSYFKRVNLIDKYWTKKYNHLLCESGTVTTFPKYFTSEFYHLVTHKKKQKSEVAQKARDYLAKKAYLKASEQFKFEENLRKFIISLAFPERIIKKYQQEIKKTNLLSLAQAPVTFRANEFTYKTYPKEIHSFNHLEKYFGDNVVQQLAFMKPKKQFINFSFGKFLTNFCNNENITFLLYLKKWLIKNNHITLVGIISTVIKYIQYIVFNFTTNKIEKINKILFDSNFRLYIKTFIFNFSQLLPKSIIFFFKQFYKDLYTYKAFYFKYLKETVKRTSVYWLKYTLDPFYQQYMKYKKFKDFYLNINVGIGPENDTDHDIIDAKFLTLYIKRLFKRNKFKVAELARTMYRSLCKLPYIDGFIIIFAGRFTRRESKIYKIAKKGVFHYGTMSKLIDYHTIGFTSKFGYCGVKVFIQYKAKWPTIEEQSNKRLLELQNKFKPAQFQVTSDYLTNNKLLINRIKINTASKKGTRLLQNLFSRNQIPYYNND